MDSISYSEEYRQLQNKLRELERENTLLKEKLEKYSLLRDRRFIAFQTINVGLVIFDSNGVILDINKYLCDYFNVNMNQVVDRNITHFVQQEERLVIREHMDAIKTKSGTFQSIFPLTINGRKHYFETQTSRLPGEMGFITIIEKITKECEREKEKEAQKLYNDFFTEALDGIVLWKESGQIIAANESALKIFESSEEKLLKSRISDFFYKKDKRYMDMIKNLYYKKSNREELMFLMPNGQKKILEFTTKLHSVEGLNMSIFRNITERYKMEEELRESKAMFENTFEEVFDGIIIWDQNYQIIDMNKAAERLLHKSKENLIGVDLISFLPPAKTIGEDIKPKLLNVEKDGQNRGLYTVKFPNNREYTQLEYRNKFNIYSGLSITTLRDITENTLLEEQLRKSSTLNVVGELAAGIAHEIRNPMTALKGFIQLLEDGVASQENEMYFSVIKTELTRIESIINEFLLLAKPQAVQYVKRDIRQIMNDTIELLYAQAVLQNVQIIKMFTEDMPTIYCEPNQLKQVFINIIKNAIEALEDGGEIAVSIEYKQDYFHIAIFDNGRGMGKEILARIGEPFYTTKEKGTGLGLLVSYQIIEEHQGKVTVESEPGVGTTFHLVLPVCRESKLNE
ncbi:sporulation sensor histidine kinase E [Niallia circulans]|uniref:ATP-binding protein n=1 Tax=Niallia circulans TaxID=1397 RepID=UPI00077CD589|nr:ATP-binding protein [Niallia circulans]MDR4315787.1 PAS domain-containing sensor histidine kinase [Niallia circulans]MED3836965.1 PAS domain S-box protein [Niallia circulans]MED4244956.1 PAS domain S-box protein [Niallia circulans]MED4249231.1 PAS domain S-box protein [Niallia circulans]QKH60902.1 PAS domain S-box protein [Niallia circulans]